MTWKSRMLNFQKSVVKIKKAKEQKEPELSSDVCAELSAENGSEDDCHVGVYLNKFKACHMMIPLFLK